MTLMTLTLEVGDETVFSALEAGSHFIPHGVDLRISGETVNVYCKIRVSRGGWNAVCITDSALIDFRDEDEVVRLLPYTPKQPRFVIK